MKKLHPFQPKIITNLFKYSNPEQINEGECFVWAYYAFLIFKDVKLCYTRCHAFVKYNGKYYDSEAHAGENDWRDLKANDFGFGSSKNGLEKSVSVKQFKYFWRDEPERFWTSWQDIEKKAKDIIRHV